MNWVLYAIAARQVVSALAYVARVGKPSKALTGPTVAGMLVVDAAIVTALVLAGMRL